MTEVRHVDAYHGPLKIKVLSCIMIRTSTQYEFTYRSFAIRLDYCLVNQMRELFISPG